MIFFIFGCGGSNIMQRKLFLLEILRNTEVEDFLKAQRHARIDELALRFSGKVNFPLAPVIEWIDALQRAEKKLPRHAAQDCYLTRKAVEQASSESTALYKASQLKGKRLLNICGGIGVDDWAFAREFESIISLEIDEDLHELAGANRHKLAISNVHRQFCRAEDFFDQDTEHYEWIYADPDRRLAGKRWVSLADCSPNLAELWPLIQQRSKFQLVKLSPLYPLEQLEKELSGLFRIEVVSWQNEVKEVLAFCASERREGPALRRSVSLAPEGEMHFEGLPEKGQTSSPIHKGYFYEAHPTLAKANLAVSYAHKLGLNILIPNGLFLQSENELPDFFGRSFEWVHGDGYSGKKFQHYLKTMGIGKANFTCRYFKQTPEELKKAHRIEDGGDNYFFFFDRGKDGPCFIHGKKLADKV